MALELAAAGGSRHSCVGHVTGGIPALCRIHWHLHHDELFELSELSALSELSELAGVTELSEFLSWLSAPI